MFYIGLDAGSVAVKVVVLDFEGNKVEGHYVRHYGNPVGVSHDLLKEITGRYAPVSLSITGSSGKSLASVLGVSFNNEIASQSYAIKKLHPQIKTVIEIGGEDSKLILLENGQIKEFSLNSVCAAGTGSFLEQQAERLNLTIEEFSKLAVEAKKASKVAGRCSVFAKSDMIHLQQIATPMEEIVSGLCFAVARNFKSSIAKGKDLPTPVSFHGGVAANQGMVKAFRDVFGLENIFVPPDFALMGALGAALKDKDEKTSKSFIFFDFRPLFEAGKNLANGNKPLIGESDGFFARHGNGSGLKAERRNTKTNNHEACCGKNESPVEAYLGIDIGSISTNLAVTDVHGRLLAKSYLMTAGKPIDAVKQGLREIYLELGNEIEIKGVGTTGSGRYMIADYVGADIVKNEITAQATAAIFHDPSVDTIFEIGGQDSKYISIRDGIIVDFEMNKACAAGTGSFLEEQAEKLNVAVKDEFAEMALDSASPCRLGERCTVFMENSLMANLQKGAGKDDLLAGLAYSIVENYINRVVTGRHIGEKIFFQGGVAFNKAVVAAFEKYTGKTVVVPPNHDVTGAIGMALIARKHQSGTESAKTQFRGFSLSETSHEISSFQCNACTNACDINKIKVDGAQNMLFYGGRCDKFDVRSSPPEQKFPDLFAFREEALMEAHLNYSGKLKIDDPKAHAKSKPKVKIGLPFVFYIQDYLPFWSTLLHEIGFEVVVSPKTNRNIVTRGVEFGFTEACFPVKVALGHVLSFEEEKVEAILMPSMANLAKAGDEYSWGVSCPHIQTIPYVSQNSVQNVKVLAPVIDLGRGREYMADELFRVLKRYQVKRNAIKNSLGKAEAAQQAFVEKIKNKGKEVLSSNSGIALAIVGRAYNAYDYGVNLEIPKKLLNINMLTFPMDMLPLDETSIKETWPNMYWYSGQKIMRAARFIRNTKNLYPLYISNFSCGPDSFILKYFSEELQGKPFLNIEIDEHSADTGIITRCEAFIDSIKSQNGGAEIKNSDMKPLKRNPGFSANGYTINKRTIFIPFMSDHSFALKAAFHHCGVDAEVLPESDHESFDIGKRYVSGKECYPYILTAGDMLKKVSSPGFQPAMSAFFMPSGSGPCRFGQYAVGHKMILKELGIHDVPIFSPNQDEELYKELGMVGNRFATRAWEGIIAYSLLTKCLHEKRPYEKNKGDAKALFFKYHKAIYDKLSSRSGSLSRIMKAMKLEFSSIPVYSEKKPLIGIVGEIYIRSHNFSNENIVEKIEALGGEAWLTPIEEWIYYVNDTYRKKTLFRGNFLSTLDISARLFVQHQKEHHLARHFKGFLKTLDEPKTSQILKNSMPYIPDTFEGEAPLSIGKAIDLIEKGASGVVSVMPFGCMPGTIVSSFFKTISDRYQVPCISIAYDGTEATVNDLQLEAFMASVKR
jgi:predicted CoA-substrate-specific enzyme activase